MWKRAVLAVSLVGTALAADAAGWRNRTIYQLLTDRFAVTNGGNPPCNNLQTYCGGSFVGIQNHLDYIEGLGFDAIWISPVVANAPNGYHGYWATDLYEINSNFGSASDLQQLVQNMHSRNMWMMFDVVANHMAATGDISTFVPFNNQSDYHDCNNCPSGCIINDYTNPIEMEHCRLAGLMDLNQSNPLVASLLLDWISNMTETYSVDGYRIDTIPYVWPWFWTEFSKAAGVYTVGEVDMGNVSWVSSYQGPIDATLSYPMFFTLRSVFAQQQSMNLIQGQWQAYQAAFKDLSVLGNFIDNHDNPRFLNERNDIIAYENALLYVLLSEGIPIIYYGTEAAFNGGNDPYCREIFWPTGYNPNTELGKFLQQVIAYRKQAQVWENSQIQRYSDDTFYAFTRGDTFVAMTNVGTNGQQQTRTISYHPYSNGQTLCNLFDCSDCVTVQSGTFQVTLNGGYGKVYDPTIRCSIQESGVVASA